jgi:GrpB-like predicted nucleotidyltransferase (UPF0157 family)
LHNLYVCPAGTNAIANHLAFRDYLRAHPDEAHRYSALKKELAQQFRTDIDAYVAGKTAFVLDALRRAGLTSEQLESTERTNPKRT